MASQLSQNASDGLASDQEKGFESTAVEEKNNYSQRPKCFNTTVEECLFVLTATMAIGMQSFFQGCIVGVTASIGSDLNMNSAEITWINAGASYVTFSVSIPCTPTTSFKLVIKQTCSMSSHYAFHPKRHIKLTNNLNTTV